MKNSYLISTVLTAAIMFSACSKNSSLYPVKPPPPDRKFRFQLYTQQDFSNDNHEIDFSIFIKTANGTIFDSALAPMLIKDIPDVNHKLIIEKTIPSSYTSDLAAGFVYEIQNVGVAGFTDTSRAGNTFKIIDFNFR